MAYSNLFYKPHGKKKPTLKAWDKANAEKNAQIRKKKIPVSLPKVSIQNETEDK